MEIKYPEHEKLEKIQESFGVDYQRLGYFLEHLDRIFVFAEWEDEDTLSPVSINYNKIISGYFKIDYEKLMQEKDQILEEYRRYNL